MSEETPNSEGLAKVEDYLESTPEPQRTNLRKLRATLRATLPTATEDISYGMPAFLVDGRPIAGYAATKSGCSYYPHSGSVLKVLEDDLKDYKGTAGALHFAADKPLPTGIVKALVKTKLAQSSDVFNGKRRDYYDNGMLKAEGSMRQGEPHGAWKWYRRDGSLMREGEFINGTQVGRWRTWDDTGRLVKETTIKR